MLQLMKPTRLEPVLRNRRGHRNEKPTHHNLEKARAQQRFNTAKTKNRKQKTNKQKENASIFVLTEKIKAATTKSLQCKKYYVLS